MPTITDPEFGQITIRRSARARQVRIRLAPDGKLRASLPMYAPLFLVKRLIKSSRTELREIIKSEQTEYNFYDGMQIGKSHSLLVRHKSSGDLKVTTLGQKIIVEIPVASQLNDPDVSLNIREFILKALRKEAKSYLPRRLRYLAEKHNYSYQRVRFSHASSRWGSCSSSGTISLNIALMKLPFDLIDYVLIHELTHTVEMNHSQNFWLKVASADPDFKSHQRELKNYSINI